MDRKNTFTLNAKQRITQKLNGLLGVWVGISFSGLLIWNGIVGMPSQNTSCNVPYPGNEAAISLQAGDTLCIPMGEVFTGRIEKLPKGALIRVNKNAIFQPIGLWEAEGSIDNHGLIVIEDILNAKGLKLDNKGKIEFRHAPGTDAKLDILNRLDASITFLSNISQLHAKLNIQNYGDVHFEGSVHLGKESKIENKGRLVLEESTVINGRVTNFGIVQSYEKVLLGPKANIQNHCNIVAPNAAEISHKGFNNNGSLLSSVGGELDKNLEAQDCASRFKSSKPVVLQFFRPQLIEDFAQLKWQVENSSRASYFELQRSFDNNNFSSLDRLEASEKEDQVYKFLDAGLRYEGESMVYYRLKMTNSQGKANYGPVVEMVLNDEKSIALQVAELEESRLSLRYKNPAQEKLELSLTDEQGTEVKKLDLAGDKAINQLDLDLTDIPAGNYTLSLSSQYSTQTEEIKVGS